MNSGQAFAFATDLAVRRWSRLFLVHPETSTVQLSAERLTISFGPWSLTTPASNIAEATSTGPYRWWKIAGPARLSVADRGITFATTTRRGVCLRFHEPVRAIDPLGLLRHPAATVTVEDPDAFIEAVRQRGVHRSEGSPALRAVRPRRGSYVAAGVALWRYARRSSSLRHQRSTIERVRCPVPSAASAAVVQRFDDGVGPAFHRCYRVRIDGATLDAAGAMARLQAEPNAVVRPRLSPIFKVDGDLQAMSEGDRLTIALAGPWNAPVEVVEAGACRLRLATLEGHLEAGIIDFVTEDLADGALQFTIESWARSGDQAIRVLYDRVGLAQALQSEMWVGVCEAMSTLTGGAQRGPVEVLTERAG